MADLEQVVPQAGTAMFSLLGMTEKTMVIHFLLFH